MNSKQVEELADRIDALVMDAYEIGYGHGGNPMRMALGQKPKNVARGWEQVSLKLKFLCLKIPMRSKGAESSRGKAQRKHLSPNK